MKLIYGIAFTALCLTGMAARAASTASYKPIRSYAVQMSNGAAVAADRGLLINVSGTSADHARVGTEHSYPGCTVPAQAGSAVTLSSESDFEGFDLVYNGEDDGVTAITATISKVADVRFFDNGGCRTEVPDMDVVTTSIKVPASIKQGGTFSAVAPNGYRILVTRNKDL